MSEQVGSPLTDLAPEVAASRDPGYDVAALFPNRWSPRAMTGDPLPESEYLSLFEAARWAPSSRNEQPWQFLYADREGEEWETFLDLLYEKNQRWASDAAVLAVVCSRRTFASNDKPNGTHAFDTGAAWQSLALEGTRRGLAVHAMAGFDAEQARDALDVPSEYAIHAMVAIGERGDPETLPEQMREREAPNDRKPLADVVTEGAFDQS